jgi:hypothetical protein
MSIAETPIAAIKAHHTATGDGVHLVARSYCKGVRLDTHMHREAQLVYAARGTMQVTTPKGRWLGPPDRAVWAPARLEHAIDVLADIEMRTLYFDLAWLRREERSESLKSEFVVRVPRLLHETILALFDGRQIPSVPSFWSGWPCSSCIMPRIPPPSFRCRMSRAAGARPTSCLATHRLTRNRDAGARGRNLGADAVAAVLLGDPIELQELVPARPHRGRDRTTVDGGQCLGQAARRRSRLRQRSRVLARLPAGHRQDPDGVFGDEIGPIRPRRRVLRRARRLFALRLFARLIVVGFALNPV